MVFLTIFLLTFNFEGLKPPNAMNGDAGRLVWPDEKMSMPSIYVVGLQGLNFPKGVFEGPAWMRKIRNELFAREYALIEEVESNGAIMAVFCKHKLLPTVDLLSVKSGTALPSQENNSCATAVSLKIVGNSFCFINTYMPYEQHLSLNSEERRNILVKLKDSISPNMDVDSHDAVVWLGSMASMLNPGDYATNDELRAWAKRGMYKNALYYDELGHLLASDDYFLSFSEPDINFPPTTWYTRDGIGKNAIPLYPDRIFFKASKQIDKLTAKNYNSLSYLAVAEHRPVFLALTLSHDSKNTVTYEFKSLPPYNQNRWSLRIDRKLEEYDEASIYQCLSEWLTDNSKIRVYEVHQFTLWKKDLKGSIELPIVKSEYSSTDQGNRQALSATVDTTKLSTLGAGGYVLCYIIDNKLVSVSDIFRL